MRIAGAMCLMMLLAGCASGPSCSGRLVPINRPLKISPHAGADAPVSTIVARTSRSPRP